MKTFADLDLIDPLLRAVEAQGYTHPTPIQEQAIPDLLRGRDMLGCAQTGTGKTAAFSLPVLQFLAENPRPRGRRVIRALVLSPTRELAAQIGESFQAYSRFLDIKHSVIFGGVKQGPQERALRQGFDVLVATPGRLMDLQGQGLVDLGHVEFFILDEADRMLDMGFIRDIRRIMATLPEKRQNLLFSATMPRSIVKLANSFLHSPAHVEVTPQSTTVERIDQQVMFVEKANKKRLLTQLIKESGVEQAIVFTRTKRGANQLVKYLLEQEIEAAAIHGNKSQSARRRALSGFRDGTVQILVATDIASRGIDVEGVSHVFNYELPNEPESYVHRIGRTGRAGRTGIAIAFCDRSEGAYLLDIQKITGEEIPVFEDHQWHCAECVPQARGGRPPRRPAPGRPHREEHGSRRRFPGRRGQGGPSSGEGDKKPPQRRRRRRRSSN